MTYCTEALRGCNALFPALIGQQQSDAFSSLGCPLGLTEPSDELLPAQWLDTFWLERWLLSPQPPCAQPPVDIECAYVSFYYEIKMQTSGL